MIGNIIAADGNLNVDILCNCHCRLADHGHSFSFALPRALMVATFAVASFVIDNIAEIHRVTFRAFASYSIRQQRGRPLHQSCLIGEAVPKGAWRL